MTADLTTRLQEAGRSIGIPLKPDLANLLLEIASEIDARRPAGRALVLGVSGAQGSGKSTIAALMETAFEAAHGLSAISMSIDDFYLTKAAREELARRVHPLCRTRGVPGTHDTALAIRTIKSLRNARPDTLTPIPRFSKLEDDRVPEVEWPRHEGQPDIIILEGWCVGAQYRDPESWGGPINALEAAKDPEGIWWRWSNAHLKDDYKALWALLDVLMFIRVPDFATVVDSRIRQEETLAAQNPHLATGRMSREQIIEFTAHYERYTLEMREDLPAMCDILLDRDRDYTYLRQR